MPHHIDLTVEALAGAGVEMAEAKVAVLGYAYLENTDDVRNSPSEVLVARLGELGAEVAIHDPWVPEYQGDLEERVQGSDAVVVMVAHDQYTEPDLIKLGHLLRTPLLIDGRNLIDRRKVREGNIKFKGLGT